MRDLPILEIAIREVAAYCEFAGFAYRQIDRSGGQAAEETFFFIHSFLAHCSTVARLVWSPEIATHARSATIAEILELPGRYHMDDDTVREILERYDRRLERGLAARGEVGKVLDYTIGDRDAFEEEFSVFLRHYDPTVDTLTLMEEELNLQRLWSESDDIAIRARRWLSDNAILAERAATPSIPPRHSREF
jgi:hypothetical protein